MSKENTSYFEEYVDTTIIAKFPPGFVQKGRSHIAEHPDEQFTMQVTEERVSLRRQKKEVDGIRPKSRVNGQIISWTFADHQQIDDNQ
jgi:hypothetical protein